MAEVWYFAIGSMMNPTSLRGRKLEPLSSRPAELLGFKLCFVFPKGMGSAASVDDDPSCRGFHGVLHKMSAEQMKVLDKIELTYDRVVATARLYDGTLQECTVYCAVDEDGKSKNEKEHPPSERYLEILTEGCRHFGVDPAYTAALAATPYTPRKRLDELSRFPVTAPDGAALPVWSAAEIEAKIAANIASASAAGDEPAAATLFRMNGKVLRYTGAPGGRMEGYIKTIADRNMCYAMSQILYDPKFTFPRTFDEMSRDHCAYIEDFFYSWATKEGTRPVETEYEVIALSDGAAVALAAEADAAAAAAAAAAAGGGKSVL